MLELKPIKKKGKKEGGAPKLPKTYRRSVLDFSTSTPIGLMGIPDLAGNYDCQFLMGLPGHIKP